MWVLEIYLSNICELIPLCRESFFCAYIKQWPKHIKYFEVFVEWARTLFLKRKKKILIFKRKNVLALSVTWLKNKKKKKGRGKKNKSSTIKN